MNNNNNSIPTIEAIVNHMNSFLPRSKKNNRGSSYQHIATQYLLRSINVLCKGNLLDDSRLEIFIGDIRDGFNHQYAGGKHWYDYLHKQFPLYYVIQQGHITTGQPIPSVVKLLVSHKELLEYRLNEDFESIHTMVTTHNHIVPIDTKNLRNYILDAVSRIGTKTAKYDKTLIQNIAQAKEIMEVAKLHDNCLPHTYNQKKFNRYYASGLNLQNSTSKEVRQASLGECYQYDISGASYAFRLGYIKHHTTYPTPALIELVEQKHHVRKRLASECLTETKQDLNGKIKLVKQALNSIGFGAKTDTFGSMKKIIWNIEDRKRFVNHPFIVELKSELTAYSQLVEHIEGKKNLKQFLQLSEGEKYNRKRAESKMYQTHETLAMQHVFLNLKAQNPPLLWVHDCIYTSKPAGIGNLNFYLHQLPYWRYAKFEEEKIDAWQNPQHKLLELEHAQRIAQEEAQAQHYTPGLPLAQIGGETQWDIRQAEKRAWRELDENKHTC